MKVFSTREETDQPIQYGSPDRYWTFLSEYILDSYKASEEGFSLILQGYKPWHWQSHLQGHDASPRFFDPQQMGGC